MEPTFFAGIVEEVKPLTDMVYFHVVGEPLMHPNFSELIQICFERDMPVAITTNGSLLNTEAAGSLLNPIVRRVNISIDALDLGKSHEFDGLMAFTRRAFAERPDLYINYRLWNLTSHTEGLDSERNVLIRKRIEDAFGIAVPIQKHSSGRKSLHLLNRLYLHLDTRFIWPRLDVSKSQNTRGFCHALSRLFAILVDGTVVPCCLDSNAVMPLGNCREHSLKAIIDSPRAIVMTKGFRDGELIEPLCRQCTFISRFASRAQKAGLSQIIRKSEVSQNEK